MSYFRKPHSKMKEIFIYMACLTYILIFAIVPCLSGKISYENWFNNIWKKITTDYSCNAIIIITIHISGITDEIDWVKNKAAYDNLDVGNDGPLGLFDDGMPYDEPIQKAHADVSHEKYNKKDMNYAEKRRTNQMASIVHENEIPLGMCIL